MNTDGSDARKVANVSMNGFHYSPDGKRILFIDDVTLENGPLEVIPGSHKGPIYSHWHDGVFTGAHADKDGKGRVPVNAYALANYG